MARCLSAPRLDKLNLPVSEVLEIPAHKRGKFVGPGGINIRRLTAETGVQFTLKEEGCWTVFAPNSEAMAEAKEAIQRLLEDDKVPEYEFGAIVTVTVTEIKEKGAIVELHQNMDPVFIPLSQLSASKVFHQQSLVIFSR
jgi:polyribonucleotide nucleotidyltransferase